MILILTFQTESDRAKFQYLYEKHKHLLLHKAQGILRDRMLAEDAVSEALIRIYRNLDKIEDPASHRATAFMVTVVRNVALTMLDKRKRNAAEELAFDPSDGIDLEEAVLSGMTTDEILELVDGLGEEYRSVFLLKYAYDLSHQEIGRILKITENNVTVRLHRARKKLAVLLAERGYAHEKSG